VCRLFRRRSTTSQRKRFLADSVLLEILRSEHTYLLLLLCVDADGTNVLKAPLLIVEPKQKLIPSAPDYVIPETAYDTIRTSIIFDFNGRVIIPWSVRRIGALGDNTIQLLPDMSDPLLNFS